MGNPAEKRQISPEEYLALERASETRHEYADGEIFAMSGGSREHSLLCTNIIRELGLALKRRRCEVHSSDMRVKIPSTGRYVYPDTTVVCGTPVFDDEHRDTLLNPIVVLEVLSDSTEAYDRGDKFEQYRSIPSFKEYVLVSQKKTHVEHFRRQSDDRWVLTVIGPGERLLLDSIQCELSMEDIYLNVFEQPTEDSV